MSNPDRIYSDVMLDLESLGTQSGCVVLSIGVSLFDRVGAEDTHETLWTLDIAAQVGAGLRIDPGTMLWWFGQSREAQDAWLKADRVMPSAALSQLATLLQSRCDPLATVWANSPQFDLSILQPLWKLAKIPCPWSYQREADMRTLRLLAPAVPRRESSLLHRADADAKAQALYVRDVFAALAVPAVSKVVAQGPQV